MADDCQDILDGIKENKYALSNVSSTIIVMDKDEGIVLEMAEKTARLLQNNGLSPCIEELNAMQAFLSSIPGAIHRNPRQFILTTKNLTNNFLPLSSPWGGSPCQDCLFIAKGMN